jgi:hypothetical protein
MAVVAEGLAFDLAFRREDLVRGIIVLGNFQVSNWVVARAQVPRWLSIKRGASN